MRSVNVASALLSIPLAAALPGAQPELLERTVPGVQGLKCLVVDALVSALSASANASPFCSSFLSIQTATVSTTTISTSYITSFVTTTTGTDTITAPTSTLDTITVDAVTAETTTFTETADAVTITTCITTDVAKRHQPMTTSSSSSSSIKGSKPTPACLSGLASPAISSACSCLRVPTPTSTVVVVSTVNPTSVVTSDVAAAATVTPLETPYFTPTVTPVSHLDIIHIHTREIPSITNDLKHPTNTPSLTTRAPPSP